MFVSAIFSSTKIKLWTHWNWKKVYGEGVGDAPLIEVSEIVNVFQQNVTRAEFPQRRMYMHTFLINC